MSTIHNALSRAGAIQSGIREAVGMKEAEAGVERLGETLTPVIDIWSRPDWAVLRGAQLAGLSILSAAVALQFSMAALRNPVGTNQLFVVHRIGFDVGADMTVFLEMATVAEVDATLGTLTTGSVRDRRRSTSFFSRGRVATGSDLLNSVNAGAFVIDRMASSSDRFFRIAPPVILPPGQAVVIVGQTVNTALVGIFAWEERALLPGEIGE